MSLGCLEGKVKLCGEEALWPYALGGNVAYIMRSGKKTFCFRSFSQQKPFKPSLVCVMEF